MVWESQKTFNKMHSFPERHSQEHFIYQVK